MTRSVHTREYDQTRKWLTTARKNARLSQQDVADRLGRPQSFVAKYELGERRLDLVEFLEVVTALNADPRKLIDALLRSRQSPK